MFRSGRRFLEPLPAGKDLLKSVESLCEEHSIQMGVFWLIGAVTSATWGVFDPEQRVYVTRNETGPFEIITCSGNLSMKDDHPVASAKILLMDETQRVWGGHLFSDTLLFYGELNLEEVEGYPRERQYDADRGLFLWPQGKNDPPVLTT